MLRIVFRLLGLLLLGGAFAALVVDGTRSVAAQEIDLLSFGHTLAAIAPGAPAKLQALVAPRLPMLWDPVLVFVLRLPAWIVLGVIGLVVFALGRPSRPGIGYVPR